jgi:integrase
MSIRKSGKNENKFMADFMVKGVRYRRQWPTYEEAAAWESELKKRIRLGIPYTELLEGTGDFITLGELADKTMVRYWEGTANERSQRSNVKIVIEHFGEGYDVSQLDVGAVDTFIFALEKKGLAKATINRRLSCLSRILTFGVDRGFLTHKPKIEQKKLSNGRMRFLTEEEEYEIIDTLEASGKDDFARFFEWQIDTGMRPIEARHISQTAVREDPQHGWLVDLSKTKNNYPRTIWLTDRAYKAYVALSDEQFPFARFTESRIATAWRFIREALNETADKEFVFYLTRHTCASRLVQRNVPLQIVKEWMGHRNFEMTLRYAKLTPTNMLDARNALQQSHIH